MEIPGRSIIRMGSIRAQAVDMPTAIAAEIDKDEHSEIRKNQLRNACGSVRTEISTAGRQDEQSRTKNRPHN